MNVKLNKKISLSEKQRRFVQSTADRVLFGGSRGGGKTWAIVFLAVILALSYPGCRILFVRPTIKSAAKQFMNYLPLFLPKERVENGVKTTIWKYKKQEGIVEFANGTEIVFGGVETENDAYAHQGIEYTFILWDELTKSDWEAVNYVIGSLRSTDYQVRFYATTNPGERSHSEVKKAFVDPYHKIQAMNELLPEGEEKYETWITTPTDDDGESIKDEHGKEVQIEWEFIPATVMDNPNEKVRTEYLRILAGLAPALRKMYLDGDWESFEGKMFTQFNESKHVYNDNRDIDFNDCDVYLSMDKGFHDNMVGVFHACNRYTGQIYKFQEIYMSQITYEEFAQEVIKVKQKFNIPIKQIILPWDMFTETSVARRTTYGTVVGNRDVDLMRQLIGSPAVKASRNRIERWRKTNSLLKQTVTWVEEDGTEKTGPKVLYHSSCVNLIHQLTYTRRDQDKPDDIAPRQEDHAIDAEGYFNISFFESLKEKYTGVKELGPKHGTSAWYREQRIKQIAERNKPKKPRRRYY